MSTLAITDAPVAATRHKQPPAPIPFRRILGVELRKMFDTRAGLWLMASIVILAVTATTAVILFAPDDALTYGSFASAIGIPMAVILPVIAILSVSSEWSQRTTLTTFTLVPSRSRSISAKAVLTVALGIVSMLVAMLIGAVGTVVGSAIAGVDRVWDAGPGVLSTIVLAQILGMLTGFMLGVLFRNTPAAVVGYFVYALVLPGIFVTLASVNTWFADNRGWLDVGYAQGALFEGGLSSQQWAQVLVTGIIWLVLPMAIGLRALLRSEIK
ncbi:MAG: ABC transporter permease [Nocardioidaceae bacterium]|nr:MAG: ABC transporter permease [Nocardioidaceae bacterium]